MAADLLRREELVGWEGRGAPGFGFLRHDEEGNLDPRLQLSHIRPHVRFGNGIRCDPLGSGYADSGLTLGYASEGNQPCFDENMRIKKKNLLGKEAVAMELMQQQKPGFTALTPRRGCLTLGGSFVPSPMGRGEQQG
jgi:hypothetical protein